jgi:CheY-like chemotaxis protein
MARILIVDDHLNLVKSLYLGLKREGFEVETANSAPLALDLVRKMEFDWVLTDLDMPSMDGKELVIKLREIKPDIRVVVMSSQTVPESLSTFPVLKKPFLFEELLMILGICEL